MSTLAGDFWVCGDCRSINNAGAKTCYNCRSPREITAVDPAMIDSDRPAGARSMDLPAFRSSRGIAVLASALLLALALMQVIHMINASTLFLQVLGGTAATDEQARYLSNLGIVTLGIGGLALIGWSLWLSRTVTAMPALGLGHPEVTPLMAFVENFIPVLNLFRVPAIVRDIVHRVDSRANRIEVLAFASWVGLLGGFFVPRVTGFILELGGNPSDGAMRNQLILGAIGTVVVVFSAIFLVAVIWWVEERIQRRRTIQLAETTAGAATAARIQQTFGRVAGPDPVETAVKPAAASSAASAPLPASEPTATPPPAPQTPSPEPVAVAITPEPRPVPIVPEPPALPEPVPVAAGMAEPAAATDDGPPHLTIRITSKGMITAEMDGQTEHIILDDIIEYASALAKAGGMAAIVVPHGDTMGPLVARRAQRILEDAGVPVTTD
jgi:hypothetical protein